MLAFQISDRDAEFLPLEDIEEDDGEEEEGADLAEVVVASRKASRYTRIECTYNSKLRYCRSL